MSSFDAVSSSPVADTGGVLSTLADVTDGAWCSNSSAYEVRVVRTVAQLASALDLMSGHQGSTLPVSGSVSDQAVSDVVFWFYEQASTATLLSSQSLTSGTLSNSVIAADAINVLITQLIEELATSSDGNIIEIATNLVSVSLAAGVFSNRVDAITTVSQIIAASAFTDNAKLAEISDEVTAVSVILASVRAVEELLSVALAASETNGNVLVIGTLESSTTAHDEPDTSAAMHALIEETAVGYVRFVINGEVYTGWVMNTQNSAVTEYQGMNFNSLAKIGTKYYGATDEGVYELAGDASDVSTYIQSGLLDFGSTQYKAVTTAYLGVDVDGRIAVGVGVSEKSGVAQHWYEVTMDKEATDNVKVPIGRGLKGRYWKFEVASESMATFEALTVLPVVLTRKV